MALSCLQMSVWTDEPEMAKQLRKAAQMDKVVITDWVKRLEATLGTSQFNADFEEMRVKLNRAEIAEIASRFVAAGSKSLSKRENLQRVYDRHHNLATSAQKRANLCRS
jgi:hypothetical protein